MSPKIFFGTTIGTFLEYFDYILFVHFSFIIYPLFFPHSDPVATAIMFLGLVAAGFISRPIGALIYGTIGDERGRRRTLSLAIFGIGLPTLCISAMPTYEQIGIMAPFALLICRFLQGLSMGGEYPIAGVFLMEHARGHRRGLYSSALCAAAGVGSLLAFGCAYAVLLAEDYDWAWRVAFFLGAIATIIGYRLRRVFRESPEFIQIMSRIGIDPQLSSEKQWQEILSNYKAFLITIGIGSFVGVLHWIPITYTSFYLRTIANWSLPDVMLATLMMVAIYAVTLPIAGIISDSIGHRKLMIWSASITIMLALPLFFCLAHEIIIPFQIGFALLASTFGAAIHPMMTDLYPASQRCRAVSIGFSLGMGTLGGVSPFIVAALVKITQSHIAPAIYVIMVASFGLWSMLVYRPYQEKSDRDDARLAA